MAKYLSGRVKRVPQSELTADRYQLLALNQAEPNLGDPSLYTQTLPIGVQQQLVSVIGYPGQRYWIPVSGISTIGEFRYMMKILSSQQMLVWVVLLKLILLVLL